MWMIGTERNHFSGGRFVAVVWSTQLWKKLCFDKWFVGPPGVSQIHKIP
jgi:hypothetical protein